MHVYTVRQINAYIKKTFTQDNFLHNVIVTGEVTNVTYSSKGHLYFTLTEKNEILYVSVFNWKSLGVIDDLKAGDKVEEGPRDL